MNTIELKLRLDRILAEEEGNGSIDWESVEAQSNELLGVLEVPIPVIVEEFLRGSDRRRQDIVYAHAQRTQLLSFLREPPA